MRARRARRRTIVASAAAFALVGVIGTGLALAASGRSGTEDVVAGPGPGAAPPTSVVRDGLRLTFEAPERASVGDRLWVTATLTNERATAVTVGEAMGCDQRLRAIAGTPETIDSVDAATDPDVVGGRSDVVPWDSPLSPVEPSRTVLTSAADLGMGWDGTLDSLGGSLRQAQQPKLFIGRAERHVAVTSIVCPLAASPPEEVAPGASISERIAIDLRWVTAASVDGDPLEVLLTTGTIAGPEGEELGRLRLRQPVILDDPTDRLPSRDAAVGAAGIPAAPTLPEWLVSPDELDGVPVHRHRVSLAWWQGAWEAWIRHDRIDGQVADPLRIRFGADRMEVVDVRVVAWNAAPSDDPDAYPDGPSEPVDEVRFSVD